MAGETGDRRGEGAVVTFEEVVDQALAMLQRRGRVTYRMLKRQFNLDDEALEDLRLELIKGQRLAGDEDGDVLVWIGDAAVPPSPAVAPAPAPTPLTWADENQRYGDEICIGERRNFCSRARSQLRGICYCVCVRFWVKYVQR
jgi:hypothetical protein